MSPICCLKPSCWGITSHTHPHMHTLIHGTCLLLVPPTAERTFSYLRLTLSHLSLICVCLCVCLSVCLCVCVCVCVCSVQATGQQPHQLHRRWSFPSAARSGDSVSREKKRPRFSLSSSSSSSFSSSSFSSFSSSSSFSFSSSFSSSCSHPLFSPSQLVHVLSVQQGPVLRSPPLGTSFVFLS